LPAVLAGVVWFRGWLPVRLAIGRDPYGFDEVRLGFQVLAKLEPDSDGLSRRGRPPQIISFYTRGCAGWLPACLICGGR